MNGEDERENTLEGGAGETTGGGSAKVPADVESGLERVDPFVRRDVPVRRDVRVCFRCQKEGHIQRDCHDPSTTLFVGNLQLLNSREELEKRLRMLTSPFGEILSIDIPLSYDGFPKNFAFVKYDKAQSVLDAVKGASGKIFNGRQIFCEVGKNSSPRRRAVQSREYSPRRSQGSFDAPYRNQDRRFYENSPSDYHNRGGSPGDYYNREDRRARYRDYSPSRRSDRDDFSTYDSHRRRSRSRSPGRRSVRYY